MTEMNGHDVDIPEMALPPWSDCERPAIQPPRDLVSATIEVTLGALTFALSLWLVIFAFLWLAS